MLFRVTVVPQKHKPHQCGDVNLLLGLESILLLIAKGCRMRCEDRCLIQPFVCRPGIAFWTVPRILLGLGPQAFEGGPKLSEHRIPQTGGQTTPLPQFGIDQFKEFDLIGHLPVLKSDPARIVEGLLIRLDRIQETLATFRCCMQFEFGGQYRLHRSILLRYFCEFNKEEKVNGAETLV